jgi:hypothetical protein
MKRKGFPVKLVVLMVAVLSTIFFADANLSFAASGQKKSSAGARPSALEHTEALIKELQGALNITDAQQELWNNLTQVMWENAKEMDALTRDWGEKTKTMNAVEEMKFHSQITEVHLAQLKKFIPPLEALYASMSDDQKKSTDTIFKTGRFGKQKRK